MIISRGFTDGTILSRGFGATLTIDRLIGIFISSRIYPVISIMSRVFL